MRRSEKQRKQEYLDRLPKMTNAELLEEYVNVRMGDDYDGCSTPFNDWCQTQIEPILFQRLKECGYLPPDAEHLFPQ